MSWNDYPALGERYLKRFRNGLRLRVVPRPGSPKFAFRGSMLDRTQLPLGGWQTVPDGTAHFWSTHVLPAGLRPEAAFSSLGAESNALPTMR